MSRNITIPLEYLVGLVSNYNLIHDHLFDELAESPGSLYRLTYPLEKAIDEILREYEIDPTELHEVILETEENGETVREAFQKYLTTSELTKFLFKTCGA